MKNEYSTYFIKDSKGFTWITSFDGLYRYDGQRFTLFKHDINDIYSLPNNTCGYVLEDKQGNIWVTHQRGLSKLDTYIGKFTNYLDGDGTDNTLKNVSKSSIILDKNGKLYNVSNTLEEIRYFDHSLNKFIVAPIDTINDGYNRPGYSNDLLGGLHYMQMDSSMYLMSWNGLFELDINTFKRKRITDQPLLDPLDFLKDHNGTFWLGEWNGGLSIISPHNKRYVIKDRRISDIIEYKDNAGKYWIIMSDLKFGGLIILDPITKKYVERMITLENETTPQITPSLLSVDEKGKLTFASAEGMIEANQIRKNFTNTYTYERGKPTDLFYENLVRSFVVIKNGYLIGLHSHRGICTLDKNLNIIERFKTYSYKNKIYDLDVKNFLRISPNKYILSGNTGIAIMENGKIIPLRYVPKAQSGLTIYSDVRDFIHKSGSEYWVRTNRGELKVFDLKSNDFSKVYTHSDSTKQLPLEGIRNLIIDPSGELWINNLSAIYKYNKLKDEFTSIPIQEKRINTSMFHFQFDHYHNLFISGSNGLLKYEIGTKKETFYNEVQGIASDRTEKIAVDKDNNVWFSTRSGLSVLDQKNNLIKNYSSKDGLPKTFMEYDGIFYIDDSNNLIIGHSGVVTKVNVEQLMLIKSENPKISITHLKGSDGNVEITLDNQKNMQANLTFKNFPVDIYFSIIDYSSNGERKYYYRYTGGDSTWIECNEGIVPINTIEPGDYTVEVRGKVNSLFSNIDKIQFTIVAKWYQTSTFKYGSILGILSIISLLIRWRFKTEKEKQNQEIKIQRLAAEQYKNQYELSRISHYFSNSLKEINNENDVLWDVAKNLIGQLNYADCMIYLWNDDKSKLIQKAGFGPKGSIEELDKQVFDVVLGQGVVGYVAETKESVLIKDTRLDARYRVDEMVRLSEICVPILLDGDVIGIIDAEHPEVDHFTQNDIQILSTIAANISVKLTELKTKTELESNKKELATTIEDLKGAQLDALRSQMNPHFIFNSLNSIENFILKNEKIIASEYLGKFSKLIRNILDNSKSEQIPIAKEIETLKLYVELERLRTGDAFDVLYDIPDDIMEDNINIPPMLMQPHVENAILHGIKHLEDKRGRLNISMTINNNDYLEYTLQDNGIGRAKSKEQKTYRNHEHKSYGIDITQNRIDLYNQRNNTNINCKVEDLYTKDRIPCGTKVTIMIALLDESKSN